MNGKILVVTGDDFGYCQSINEGILDAYKKGVLRSVSVMTTGEGYENAVMILKNNPGLDPGIHISLVASRPLSDPSKIPSLCDNQGNFISSYLSFSQRLFTGNLQFSHVETEINAQVNKFMDSGLRPSHIDSHQHVHIMPGLWDIMVKMANRHSIPFIRVPDEHVDMKSFTSRRANQLTKYMFSYPLITMRRKNLHKTKLKSCDHFHGLLDSGNMTSTRLHRIIANIKPGINELMCHPGYPPPQGDPAHEWGYKWEKEISALTSKKTFTLLEKESVIVSNFRNILDGDAQNTG